MNVAITGSRKGIRHSGSYILNWLHDYFTKLSKYQGYNVTQLSRETGYDFNENFDDIVNEILKNDVFVNASCIDDYQIKLLNAVYGKVKHIICIGSIAGDFNTDEDYARVKRNLKQRCKMLPIETLNTYTNLFHMTISEVEKDGKGMSQEEFNKVLDFWFENPTIANIDFKHYVESYDDWKKEKIKRIVDEQRS